MNEYIDKEINSIKNEYDYGNNLNKLLNTEITNKNEEIIYKSITDGILKIFGSTFVNNNIKKCKIVYKNKEYELKEYINDIDKKYNNKDEIKIKLKGINKVTNMSGMFDGCKTLSSLPDISKWDTSKVTNMSDMFSNCKKSLNFPSKFKR